MQTRLQKGNFNVDFGATNPIVTNQAMEFWQAEEGFSAVNNVPLITVPAQSGQLAFIKMEYLNRDEVALRSSSMTEAEKGMLGVGTVAYSTDERALEYILSASDAAKLGYEFGYDVPQSIPRALAHKANIHTEGLFSTLIWNSGAWYRTVTGNASDSGSEGTTAMNRVFWANQAANPIPGIIAEKRIFLLRTGLKPNTFRMGFQAFETLASHPLVRAQVAVTTGGATTATLLSPNASEAQLSAILGMRVVVSWGVKNTSMVDGSPSNAFIIDPADALMTYEAGGEYRAEASRDGGPYRVTLGQPTGLARVAWDGVTPNGFQVRGPIDRPTIGSGGSKSWILDMNQGFVVVDKNMGTFFNNMLV